MSPLIPDDDVIEARGPIAGEVLPPDYDPRAEHVEFETIEQVRRQMTAVFWMSRRGLMKYETATKLVYMLDNILKAMRTEKELEDLEAKYAEAITGLVIIGPETPPEIVQQLLPQRED